MLLLLLLLQEHISKGATAIAATACGDEVFCACAPSHDSKDGHLMVFGNEGRPRMLLRHHGRCSSLTRWSLKQIPA